eukprot:GHVS01045822.1.p1 GENE.GHVS01045822.1~~GHVS01045822.1.p1  ORF type:complete len:257 (-),score=26.46 GHVS01045822.1:400-1170(-)
MFELRKFLAEEYSHSKKTLLFEYLCSSDSNSYLIKLHMLMTSPHRQKKKRRQVSLQKFCFLFFLSLHSIVVEAKRKSSYRPKPIFSTLTKSQRPHALPLGHPPFRPKVVSSSLLPPLPMFALPPFFLLPSRMSRHSVNLFNRPAISSQSDGRPSTSLHLAALTSVQPLHSGCAHVQLSDSLLSASVSIRPLVRDAISTAIRYNGISFHSSYSPLHVGYVQLFIMCSNSDTPHAHMPPLQSVVRPQQDCFNGRCICA